MDKVKACPDGYHTINVYLSVRDCARAIDWYTKALGAHERYRLPGADGKIAHAELGIGDSVIMVSDEAPEMDCTSPQTLNGSPVTILLYVDNVDKVWEQATSNGAKVTQPLENMFWGDRYGHITDPFGHKWGLAQHIEDLTPEQLEERKAAWEKEMQAVKK